VARTSPVATPDELKLDAAALHTYYAYFGTWDYNAATSVISHHISSSLLPYESGLEDRREVVLDGAHLKLTARSQVMGEERHRTLVWTRISDAEPIVSASAAPPASAQVTPPTAASAALAHTESPPPVREQDSKYGTMPTDYKQAIQKYFLEHMKYPDSVQYQEITKPEQGYTTAITGGFFMREKREYGWTVKATINAKNSRGSYVGLKTYTFLFRGEMIVDARLPLPGDEMKEPTR